jgi:5'-3' exoribonuclease 2
MANMSAAEVLKAELAGLSPVKPTNQAKPEKAASEAKPESVPMEVEAAEEAVPGLAETSRDEDVVIPDAVQEDASVADDSKAAEEEHVAGSKRSFEEGPGAKTPTEEGVTAVEEEDEDEGTNTPTLALKVNPDGSVEQEDTVK